MRIFRQMVVCLAVLFASGGQAQAGLINLTDDSFALVDLDFTFNFFGTDYTNFYVGSNGFITFGSGDTDFSESVSEFLSDQPRIAGFWVDLNPAAGGTIDATGDANSMVVSFSNVPEFGFGGSNTFSITLFSGGNIDISFGSISSTDGIVGISPGGGAAAGAINFSAVNGPYLMSGAIYEQFNGPFDLSNQTLSFVTSVPEPSSLAFFGLGLCLMVSRGTSRRRRGKN